MAKRPVPDEAERDWVLLSLNQVGPSKPVGYLPLYTIRDFVQLSTDRVAADAKARGLNSQKFGPSVCCIKSGALYVYDSEALARVLEAHAEVLKANNVPLRPDPFVAHIAAVWFKPNDPVHAVIAEAFGEKA